MGQREDELRRQMGFPSEAGMNMYASLRYCGTCPGGPLLYADGTCPRCGKSNPATYEETEAKTSSGKP